MGKVERTIADRLIDPHPDRNANRLRVYRKENGEVVIHLRNLKILLFPHQVDEWRTGFKEALHNFRAKDYMKNDL